MAQKNKDRLMEVLLYRQEQLYRSEDYERIMFEFAVFNAHLSGTKREIQIEIDKMISIGQPFDRSHEKFEPSYDRWKNGWGIKFEGNKSSRIQVLN